MGQLINKMGEHLTGRRVGMPRTDRSAQGNAEILVSLAGSGRAAARMIGRAESTFRGWRKGVKPAGSANQAIVSAARRLAALNSGQLARAVADPALAIRGTFTVSQDTRTRTIYPGRHIPSASMRTILNEWARGEDDQTVEDRLTALIDAYYQPLQFNQIERVWFE